MSVLDTMIIEEMKREDHIAELLDDEFDDLDLLIGDDDGGKAIFDRDPYPDNDDEY